MSTYIHQTMTNDHASVGSTGLPLLRLWRERYQQRRELARWTERDLHDLGLSWSEMLAEADKPFWRA